MSNAPEAAPEEAPKKSKKMLFIVLGLVVLLLIAIGVGGFLFLKAKHADEAGDEEEEVVEKAKPHKKAEPGKPPAFIALEPFTANLSQEQGEAPFIQLVISLRIEDAHMEAQIKNFMPQIRHDVLRILASQKASELHNVEGRDHLQETLKDTINQIIEPTPPGKKVVYEPIEAVLFTSFIIQ